MILNPQLCVKCDSIFQNPLDEIYRKRGGQNAPQPHHRTVAEFRDAATRQNCRICLKNWLIMADPENDLAGVDASANASGDARKYALDMTYEVIAGHGQFEVVRPGFPSYVQFEWFGADNQRFWIWHCLMPNDNKLLEAMPLEEYLHGNTSSENSLATIGGWIDECVSEHETCQRRRYTPSRLVYIGRSGPIWRLCTAEELKAKEDHEQPQYVTLSYRWGHANSITLTTANLETFRSGLQISDLPQTFQDLVRVARHLSLEYLWIDSLCIIQDSLDDWNHESVCMRDVYTSAYCCIAAAWGTDPTSGLFSSRNIAEIECIKIHATWKSTSSQDLTSMTLVPRNSWNSDIMVTPLHRRGWALQERLLPPRVIQFTRNQILWECDTDRKSEVFPLGMPWEASMPWGRKERLYTWISNLRHPAANSAHMPLEMFHAWIEIVRTYSCCELTMSRDKLVAIAGLAELFQELSGGDTYLAGLWRSKIFDGLCWLIEGEKGGANPAMGGYRAPSWSWASIDGPVFIPYRYDDDTYIYPCELLDVHVTTDGEAGSPRSQVLGGLLVLRGHAFIQNPRNGNGQAQSDCAVHTILDTGADHQKPLIHLLLMLLTEEDGIEGDKRDVGRESDGQTIYRPRVGQGMLLQQNDENTGEYMRVGSFNTLECTAKDMEKFGLRVGETGRLEVDPSAETSVFRVV